MSQPTDFLWKKEYAKLAEEICRRHYSPNTLKSYQHWVRSFETFTCSKPAHLLSAGDVKSFLTYLSAERKMPPVTQNQALNALFFFSSCSKSGIEQERWRCQSETEAENSDGAVS